MRLTTKVAAAAVATALSVGLLTAAPAAAAGDRSLAAVLTAKTPAFDRNWHDYDIVTAAVVAVLGAKPQSPVSVLTDGTVALTAFIPNDRAFQKLVKALTGKTPVNEKATFNAVAGLGIDTVETVLLYHVVPGATITAAQALKSNGVRLTSALSGKTIIVRRLGGPRILLVDENTTFANPKVIGGQVNINRGNLQIAHGIDAVIMPKL